jgi:anti-anti-sigma regulatory factor
MKSAHPATHPTMARALKRLQIQHIPPMRYFVALARGMQETKVKIVNAPGRSNVQRKSESARAIEKEIPMNSFPFESAIIDIVHTTELVRGQEQRILEQLKPLVREQNVTLDLRNVKRIDAAGLAALISLYCDSCKAGHRFRVVNPMHHVAELLALVRLDTLLVTKLEDECVGSSFQLQVSAA